MCRRRGKLDVLSFSLPWSERSYRYEVTENRASSCWVAEVGGQVVGMIVNWIILDEAHIATIAVHPQHRRAGIGKCLLAQGLLAAWERGARTALLEVRAGNLPAQAMYLRFGFEVVGKRPHYYKDNNEDALLMTLKEIDPKKIRALLD
jgi:ribosomal-protein-alanine N-acetyltransferase